MSVFQFANITCFVTGMRFLPISTAIIVRGGASLFFVGIFAFIQGQMNLYVGLSMLVVFAGTVFGCVPVYDGEMFTFEDMESLLWYLAGIGAVVLSAFCQAGRLVFQEISFVTNKRISPLQLASLVALVSVTFTSMMLVASQLLPGFDNGKQEDTIDTLIKVYRSGDEQPLLTLVLLLVIAANFCNSERIVFLVRWYGAATTKVLLSLEIVTTWFMAVGIFYLCQALHEPLLAGVGEEFILGEAYLRMIGGGLVIVGSELHLKSKRELNESRQQHSPRPEAP
uniref:EamA domain-containing protein n=2 Tax=Cryptomonas curvata TaxID=233186 RepID=A0A7S0N4H7_9CRYP|mmetsp:Transcript_59928/g.125318  ORF Transcript_59928/g.125318 Transcript_59928/m.125318 type:complete len:282 (+) Transcript_59928:482-1327(+)|eukprot:CAMPEP_0172171078 /NCGR_PEP_ID=MMETSP1050-20130122/11692_2 /TAXON_ID=233186 /ORGANISM="Cryptomonas curvata, Strain CCAP979/52" /LENGTH=281 /DNA_ID=CAMNT_0012842469 /DNA_START=527 /DNA_END=1372 /DNA_ORIENTATION=-